MKKFCVLLFLVSFVSAAHAGKTDVMRVVVKKTGLTEYHFEVTLRHADTGWDHYANKWEVRTEDGSILGTRILSHPHVDEQPFTRALSGVEISSENKHVMVRGYDSVHHDGGQELRVELPLETGDIKTQELLDDASL